MFHLWSSLHQCDSMILPSTPTVRRGSTPLPIKHQLRREEAVHDDCDWTSGAAGPSVSPISFSPALDDNLMVAFEGRPDGPLKIALLGQNGVGKSSLAIALAGEMDRTASVDSDGTEFIAAEFCTEQCHWVGRGSVMWAVQQVNKSQHPSPMWDLTAALSVLRGGLCTHSHCGWWGKHHHYLWQLETGEANNTSLFLHSLLPAPSLDHWVLSVAAWA